MTPSTVRAVLAVALCTAIAPLGFSQSQATPPVSTDSTASDASSSAATKLEQYTVTDVPIDRQILPTSRPVSSVLGDPGNIVDTPRSVSEIDSAWLADRQVMTAMDLGQFSPGTYSPSSYGEPSETQIRGDYARYYLNGQGMLDVTPGLFLPSFNGVQALDIVKGPGSAVYGPQGGGPGGYINVVSKQPFFDAYHTEVDVTLGDLVSGHDDFNPSVTIDVGGPLTSNLAFRVSYLSRYGDGYYQNDPDHSQDVFGALTYKPTPNLTLEFVGQGYSNDFIPLTGVNRVTQQFIDHGTYVAGSVIAYPDTPPYGLGYVDGTYGVLDPTTAHTVQLSRRADIVAPNDYGSSSDYKAQLVATLALPHDASLVNRAYYEYLTAEALNNFGFSDYVPKQFSIQDRLEYHQNFSVAGFANKLITGIDFRMTRTLAYNDFAIEPLFYFDLSQPSSQIKFPAAPETPTLGAEYAVPQTPGMGASPSGNSAVQDSWFYQSAVFVQDEISWTHGISSVIGLRVDDIEAEAESPPLVQVFSTATGTVYNPGIYLPGGALFSTSDRVYDPSFFGSLMWKPTPDSNVYFTYNRTDAILGSQGAANVSLIADGTNTPIGTPAQYKHALDVGLKDVGTLYEVGYKRSLLNNSLYIDATLYQQTKSVLQTVGPAYAVKAEGFEAEAVYQLGKAWEINGNFTYQNVTDFGSYFYQQTSNYLDGYPVGYIVDGQSGTGNGSPNYGGYIPPTGRMKAPGMPQVLANFFLQYELPSGFGIGIGPQIQGKQYANDQETLHIPTEYQLDSYLYYRARTWDVHVNIKNLTDRRNLDPVDVTYAGNDLIWIRQPISASLSLRYHY